MATDVMRSCTYPQIAQNFSLIRAQKMDKYEYRIDRLRINTVNLSGSAYNYVQPQKKGIIESGEHSQYS